MRALSLSRFAWAEYRLVDSTVQLSSLHLQSRNVEFFTRPNAAQAPGCDRNVEAAEYFGPVDSAHRCPNILVAGHGDQMDT